MGASGSNDEYFNYLQNTPRPKYSIEMLRGKSQLLDMQTQALLGSRSSRDVSCLEVTLRKERVGGKKKLTYGRCDHDLNYRVEFPMWETEHETK